MSHAINTMTTMTAVSKARALANGAEGRRKSYAVAWIYGRGCTDTDGKAIVRVMRGTKAAITAWLDSSAAPDYISSPGYREAVTVAALRAMGRDPAQVEHWVDPDDQGVEHAL